MKKSYKAILKVLIHFEGFDFYDGVSAREIAKLLNDFNVYDIPVQSVASHLGNMRKLELVTKVPKWNGQYYWAYGRQMQSMTNYWKITERGRNVAYD